MRLQPHPLVPANICLFKVSNRSTAKKCEICSKLAIKTSDIFIASFEHISHLFLVFLLLTLNMEMLVRRTQNFERTFIWEQLVKLVNHFLPSVPFWSPFWKPNIFWCFQGNKREFLNSAPSLFKMTLLVANFSFYIVGSNSDETLQFANFTWQN